MLPSVLIVDDEPSILKSLSGLLADDGFEVLTASNGYEALKTIEHEAPDLVLLDIWMPGIDGIDTLVEIKKKHPQLQVIIITGHGNIEMAVKATKLGAFDLIEKPLSIDKVIVAINNALNFRRLEEENRYLRKKTIDKHSITGVSAVTLALKQLIATTAPTDSWILISGENGTGKELVARTIHQLSPRVESPMITVNCATLSDGLAESELFGHERGVLSATPAKQQGICERVGQGTLFFDEIGDMSLSIQGKLLRVLQSGEFQRVGGARALSFRARVIASTNKNLEREIEQGRFREDLYYRLNVVPIQVPPLRARAEDIPLLVDAFLQESAQQGRGRIKRMEPETLTLLGLYPWPGNVRELKNLVERLVIMTEGETIAAAQIPPSYRTPPIGECAPTTAAPHNGQSLADARRAFEYEFVQRTLRQHAGDVAAAAETMGVTVETVRRVIASGEGE